MRLEAFLSFVFLLKIIASPLPAESQHRDVTANRLLGLRSPRDEAMSVNLLTPEPGSIVGTGYPAYNEINGPSRDGDISFAPSESFAHGNQQGTANFIATTFSHRTSDPSNILFGSPACGDKEAFCCPGAPLTNDMEGNSCTERKSYL